MFGIVVLSLNGPVVSLLALVGAIVTAGIIYLLSIKNGFAGTRLILIGIGVAAMLQSVISYMLSRAASWDIQTAMQWLTGSLNNASWERVIAARDSRGGADAAAALAGARTRSHAARR